MDDFLKKLASLGFNPRMPEKPSKNRGVHSPISEVINGEWLNDNEKAVFISEMALPYPVTHGNFLIQQMPDFRFFSDLLDEPAYQSFNTGQFLFLDTETTNLGLGAGTLVFLVGFCWFDGEGLKTRQFFLEDISAEPVFLLNIQSFIENFAALVSFNGKTFDIPLLRSRFVINLISEEIRNWRHIDLLHVSRNLFKRKIASKRLVDIETEILNFQRKGDDIPGWLIPQAYFDYLETGESASIANIFYHNRMDIISLAALARYLAGFFGGEIIDRNIQTSLAEIFMKNRNFPLSLEFFSKDWNDGDFPALDPRGLMNLAYVLKKTGNWEQAVKVWEKLAQDGNLHANIELAKYFEHHQKHSRMALEWTEKAIMISTEEFEMIELDHRKNRLLKKVANENG